MFRRIKSLNYLDSPLGASFEQGSSLSPVATAPSSLQRTDCKVYTSQQIAADADREKSAGRYLFDICFEDEHLLSLA